MTGEQTLLARCAVGAAGSCTGLILVSVARLRTVSNDLFNRLTIGALVLSRFGLFAIAFLILRLQVRGDIPSFYWVEAQAVMHHRLPYRDFLSSYAPLHPYLDAAALHLWFSPLAIILLAILSECALLPLWLSVGRRLFPEQQLRTAALLYIANPMSLIFVSIDGQDNVTIALLLAAAMALLIRRSEAFSGAAVALAISAIKILPLLFTPVFFLATPRRWRWAAGALAVLLAIYGTAFALHLPIAQPLTAEGKFRTAGNLPYVFEAIWGVTLPGPVWDSLVLIGLFAVLVLVASIVRRQSEEARLRVVTFGTAAIILTLVLLSKKGWPNYLMLILFPVCLLARRMGRGSLVLFSAFSTLAVFEHSYWASMLRQRNARELHVLFLTSGDHEFSGRMVAGLAVTELLLIAGYCWLLVLSLREIAAAPHVLAAERGSLLQ